MSNYAEQPPSALPLPLMFAHFRALVFGCEFFWSREVGPAFNGPDSLIVEQCVMQAALYVYTYTGWVYFWALNYGHAQRSMVAF